MFVPFGTGNNGKTTLLSTFLDLLDEYFVPLQVDTLRARQESNNTRAELADLRGARFVMTSEAEEDQRLSERAPALWHGLHRNRPPRRRRRLT